MTRSWSNPFILFPIFLFACLFPAAQSFSDSLADKPSDEFFGLTKLWTIHLKFTPDQWKAIEPAGGFGFPGGPGGPGGPPRMGNRSTTDTNQRPAAERRPEGGMRRGGPFGGIEFPYVSADFEFEGQTIKNVSVRFKGQASFMTSRNSPKKSFKIDFDKNDKQQRFYGMKKLTLNNNIMDPSQMLDSLGYETYRAFGIPSPRTAYAKVFLTVDGVSDHEYLGLYTVVEQIDEVFLKNHFNRGDGLLLKPQMVQGLPYFGRNWEDYEIPYEPKSTDVTWKQAKQFMDFTELVNDATDSEFQQKIADYTDVDQFLQFLAVTVVIANYDSILGMGQNYYIYGNPENKKYVWLPWDLNMSFGIFMMAGSAYQQMEANIQEPNTARQPLIERVLAIPEWKEKYLGYIREFTQKVFIPERISKNIADIQAAIGEAVKEDPNGSYESFQKCASNDPISKEGDGRFPFPGGPPDQRGRSNQRGRGGFGGPGGPGGGPGGPMMMPGYSLSSWVKGRYESVLLQLDGKSEGVKMARRGFGGPGGGGPGGGGPGGRGGFGGPGGGGPGRPGDFEPGEFGPGMFLGPQLLSAIDTDKNGKVAQAEFEKNCNEWSISWDTDKNQSLTEKELTDGLGKIFRFPDDMPFGPPEGFSPGMMLLSSFKDKTDDKGNLSSANFVTLWKEWFTQWDADKNGELYDKEIASGLNSIIRPPEGFGPPPGFDQGPPGF